MCRGVAELGLKWRTIAGRLPGRSDDAVRNRWKRLIGEKGAGAADPDDLDVEGSNSSGRAKAKKVTERLAWSREEDDLIVRSVQQVTMMDAHPSSPALSADHHASSHLRAAMFVHLHRMRPATPRHTTRRMHLRHPRAC